MSVAIMPMSDQFGWTASTQGMIQASFLWGYASTQLLGGSFADKLGGKKVMLVGIIVFALACASLPIALGASQTFMAGLAGGLVLPIVLTSRVLVGMGEGVIMPGMNNLLATSVPPASRARAIGQVFTGFHGGTLLGLLASPFIIAKYGWPALFFLYGLLGLPLLAFLQHTVPEPEVESADAGERDSTGVAVAALLTKPATWAIIAANFVNHWGYFIYLNWMPIYFNKVLKFNVRTSALYSFLPWLVMAVMSYVAGWIADKMVNSGMDRTKVRKIIQSIAFAGPALALLPMATTTNATVALACFTSAMACTAFSQAGYLANMQDIAPRYAGRLFGLANTAGSLAGVGGTAAAGIIIDRTGSFQLVFQLMVAVYLIGLLVYNTFCTAERIFD